MNSIIELNLGEIDSVVGGVSAGQAAALQQMAIPNKTMMATPNVSAYSAAISRPAVATYSASALQARLDALR
jgi:hypothetical protein